MAIALAASTAPAAAAGLAPDQLALSVSYGESTVVYDVGAVWGLPWHSDFLEAHNLRLALSADIARWQSHDLGAPVTWLWDFSATPLLRWSLHGGARESFFVEAGIGAHLLSRTELGDVKRFSTAFQFGERLALGTTFGTSWRYEIAAYLQHVSNAEIKLPNSGLTQWGATVRLPLD